MKKQTALEWLIEQVYLPIDAPEDVIQQAKQMERQQIIDAVDGYPLNARGFLGEGYYDMVYGDQSEESPTIESLQKNTTKWTLTHNPNGKE